MPIPPFDHNLVLPPHLGDPTQPSGLSPYPCTALELCDQFATSPERVAILEGWLRLRERLRRHGMLRGFQWIDGSFVQDIEAAEARSPKDIDVVTFYHDPDPSFAARLLAAFPEIVDHGKIKANYSVDHYIVDYGFNPDATVEQTRYWSGLFSHTRGGTWKGMLRVELNTPSDDAAALALLAQRAAPTKATP